MQRNADKPVVNVTCFYFNFINQNAVEDRSKGTWCESTSRCK